MGKEQQMETWPGYEESCWVEEKRWEKLLHPSKRDYKRCDKTKQNQLGRSTNRAGSEGAFLVGLDCRGVVDMSENFKTEV
jgi:hypothetical protein